MGIIPVNTRINQDYYGRILNNGRNSIKNEFLSMKCLFNVALFNRRTEIVKFHPNNNKLLLFICSHGGDIAIIDNNNRKSISAIEMIREGKGKGGSICALEFDNNNPNTLYFGSHDTKLTRYNYEIKSSDIIMETFDCDHWYTSITHSSYYNSSSLLVGDNKGILYIVDPRESKSVATGMKIHKGKIHDINAHIDGNIFCTASNDKTVQLWDLRTMKFHENDQKKHKSLLSLKHDGVVSSSVWSPHDSNRLLTTTQNDEFRIYDCNLGVDASPEIIINHPHRFYQHLSIIKPIWHPIVPNLFVCGRYDKDIRGIDMFDINNIRKPVQLQNDAITNANTNSPEHYVGNLQTLAVRTINCALTFSTDGSLLASGTANNVAIFSTSATSNSSFESRNNYYMTSSSNHSQNNNSPASVNEGQRIVAELRQQQQQDNRKRKGANTDCVGKVKTKAKTKTTKTTNSDATSSSRSRSTSKTKDNLESGKK